MNLPKEELVSYILYDPDSHEYHVMYPHPMLLLSRAIRLRAELRKVEGVRRVALANGLGHGSDKKEPSIGYVIVEVADDADMAEMANRIRAVTRPGLPATAEMELTLNNCPCGRHNSASLQLNFLGGLDHPDGNEQVLAVLQNDIDSQFAWEELSDADPVQGEATASRLRETAAQHGIMLTVSRIFSRTVSCDEASAGNSTPN